MKDTKRKLSIFSIILISVVALIISLGFLQKGTWLYYFSAETRETITKADELIDGIYVTAISENDDEYVFEYTGNIYSVENENRSIQRRVYNFEFLETLKDAYELTKDKAYIETGMQYIQDFTEQATFDQEHMTWHDETTARRLNYYFDFYKAGYDELNPVERQLIADEMEKIATLIGYTEFYSGLNNHGMYQDSALLKYAVEFERPDMIEKASGRLEEYFVGNFDKAGVHLENSPEYHFHMVTAIKELVVAYDEETLPVYDTLNEIYEKSANYANMVTLPNGIIPNIGDSKNMEIDLKEYYSPKIIKESQNSGRATYYESGYDIVKEDNTYFLFRAGYLKDYHHHNDDLSFWLYKDGNIFTEVGSYGYMYDIPYTHYAKTFPAHNSLVVDGENEAETKDVFLLDSQDPNIMSGETHRIVGTTFKRDIHFNDELTEFTITDTVESLDDEEHSYEFFFHLDPAISVNVTQADILNVVDLIRDGETIGQFQTEENIKITEDVYFPYYYAEPETTQVIVIEAIGNGTKIESKIILN